MEIICSRSEFAKGLKLAESLADRVSALSALQGILLEASKNTLTIRSTDLNTGFEMSFVTQVKKEGRAVIPVRPSIQLVSSVSGEALHIETDGAAIHFTTQNTTSSVKGYSSDDFPKLPRLKGENRITIATADFLSAVHKTVFAASRSDIRPEIASVSVRGISDGLVKMAATDSFRLSEASFKSDGRIFSFLFPWKRLTEFAKILEQFDGPMECIFDGQQFFASHKDFSYFTRLTEGKFPDYEQVIPTSFISEAVVNRTELIENLRVAGIFSGQLKEVRFKTYPADQLLEILTIASDVGEHSSRIKAQITGEPVEMSFNQRYVAEGLDPLVSDTVLLRFSGAGRPLLIQDPSMVSYLYLAMPMKSV